MTLILNGTSGLSDVDGSAATPAIRGTDANTGIFFPAADTIAFSEGGAEIARFDSSGNLGIGTSSMSGRLNVKAVDDTASGGVRLWGYNDGAGNGDRTVYISSISGSGNYNANINYSAWNHLFSIGGVEKARITSDGNLLVGRTSAYSGYGNAPLQVEQTASNQGFVLTCSNAAPYGAFFKYTAASPNSTAAEFLYCADSTALRMSVRSNGGIANYSANNVNLSDERTKTDIVDAGGYLAKICAIPVRTFKYKDQTDDLLNLGVIAQEVESVAPELVDASGFGETPEDGIPLKAIYQTDLQYALMKCIQELKALVDTQASTITQLQADVAALKAQP